jgi:anaerobic ribonucleoside-triphosphate reductase activating protein
VEKSGGGVLPHDEVVVSRLLDRTRVLGPGARAVVWVRGCPLRCAGCIAAEDLPFEGGTRWSVPRLAGWLNGLPADVTGLTFSGGEPMAQAGALARLVDAVRADRDWSTMSYSGFTLERLRRHGDPDQRALLERLDLLVDGPYLEHRHADLRWRGSDNQRVHHLSARHAPLDDDRSAGVEMTVVDGALRWTGVPAVPGFRAAFESAMAREGAPLAMEEEI